MNNSSTAQRHLLSIYRYFSCRLRLWLLSVAVILGGCQGNIQPAGFGPLTESMQKTRITTSYHQHFVLAQRTADVTDRIHIYIEGDGRPWIKRYLIAEDPTPRAPLTLSLMRQAPQPAFFLGRPCSFTYPFHGLADAASPPPLWTGARYSEPVTASRVDALRQLPADQHS